VRAIAIALNIILVGTVIYLMLTVGVGPSGEQVAFAALCIAAPIASLLAFYFNRGESWLSLYLKRKTLEEKAKIERLNETRRR